MARQGDEMSPLKFNRGSLQGFIRVDMTALFYLAFLITMNDLREMKLRMENI